ncbi:hypothetical protein N7470_004090 [Penicillium chermesinum]|nr:hypothetical protein N7470_004090 [Penicillium chermesinum]
MGGAEDGIPRSPVRQESDAESRLLGPTEKGKSAIGIDSYWKNSNGGKTWKRPPHVSLVRKRATINFLVAPSSWKPGDPNLPACPWSNPFAAPQSAYKESIPHLAIPPAIRQHHLVGGSLAGLGKLALAPYMWTSSTCASEPRAPDASSHPKASSVVSVFHIGRDLCGHPGFVHGGLLSVLFDEVFARCVSAAFPSGLGMTANLNVDFRKPALPDRLYVLRAETTKVEGRKAWVAGKMICLPLPVGSEAREVSDVGLLEEDSPGAVMVAEGKALFVEPKFASVSLLS